MFLVLPIAPMAKQRPIGLKTVKIDDSQQDSHSLECDSEVVACIELMMHYRVGMEFL